MKRIRLGLILFSALAAASASAALLTHLPRHLTSDSPIAFRIDDGLTYSGFEVGVHVASVAGKSIRIDGCIGGGGFAVAGSYWTTVGVPPLPPGTYTVDYFRTICGSLPFPPRHIGTWTVEVRQRTSDWPPSPGALSEVFEYFHMAFWHYFITSSEPEQVAIEGRRFEGWQRMNPFPNAPMVGRYAFMNADGADGRLPLCRFFSDAFAPKSSHFYTASPKECETVKQNPVWKFEGIVGYVWPAEDDGSCSRGVPVYRLYNNGKGGAPNHRYTIDAFERVSMIREGWGPEGPGLGVAFCAPRPE